MKFYWKSKQKGQSIPIIAMMIVILFAMVGLSVDVGNTYAEQRNVVRATDAAALAGMQKMLEARGAGVGDSDVDKVIRSSLKSNGIVVAGPDVAPEIRNQRQVTMSYLDASGNLIDECQVGGCGLIPESAKYIKVTLSGVVDTYFARVVGQQTLPVGATAYSAYCAPKDSVFPLAVNINMTEGPQFAALDQSKYNPSSDEALNELVSEHTPAFGAGMDSHTLASALSGKYTDDPKYPFQAVHQYWRKLFLVAQNGTFEKYQTRLLSWREADKAQTSAMAAAFQGTGTLAQGGVDKAAWPTGSGRPAPTGYPRQDREINLSDWLYSFGESASTINTNDFATVRDALQTHMRNRDTLILPIVNNGPEAGSDSYYHYQVEKMGLFRIANGDAGISIGKNTSGTPTYLAVDLVYLGPITGVACLQVPPTTTPPVTVTPCPSCAPTPVTTPTITPPINLPSVYQYVQVKPVWTTQVSKRQPISYQVLLDVTGSMGMTMDGHAYSDYNGQGHPVLCADPTQFGKPANDAEYDPNCIANGDANYWREKTERRIYIAKQAVIGLVNGMNKDKNGNAADLGDTMRIIAFSGGTQGGVDYSVGSNNVKVLPANGWSMDKAVLTDAVTHAGSFGGNDYLTAGGTSTPQALQATLGLLRSAPTSYNGNTYKKVVILVTDGMANIFMNGQFSYGTSAECLALNPRSQAFNKPSCQYSTTGESLPINQMIEQAGYIKASDPNLQLYVVGMSQVPPYGLEDAVPSSPSMYYAANTASSVSSALQAIQTAATTIGCEPHTELNFQTQIDDTNRPVYAAPNYGYVTIKDSNGNVMPDGDRIPIVQDPTTNNRLGWVLPPGKLPPGTYTVNAEVGYKGKDGEQRLYKKIDIIGNAFADETTITVPSNVSGDKFKLPDDLKMNFDSDLSNNLCTPDRR